MPIAAAEQNRAALAIANAGDDYLALASADPGAAGNNLIAAAGRAQINLGRENADAAGEVKNLAAVDFQPTGLVQNATHFAIMTAAGGGTVRAWGRLVDAGNNSGHGLATVDRRYPARGRRRRRRAYSRRRDLALKQRSGRAQTRAAGRRMTRQVLELMAGFIRRERLAGCRAASTPA